MKILLKRFLKKEIKELRKESSTTPKANSLKYDLINYVKKNDIKKVAKILKKGEDVDTKDDSEMTLLLWSSIQGYIELTKLLISRGADINYTLPKYGWTPLLCAVEKGHYKIIKLLIEKGADVNYQSKFSKTALISAVEKGYIDIAELLIKNGADINLKDYKGRNVGFHAVNIGDYKLTKYLIERGIEIEQGEDGYSLLLATAKEKGYTKIVRLLIEKEICCCVKN